MSRPLCTIYETRLDRPSLTDKRADFERLKDFFRREELSLSLEDLRKLPALLREGDFLLSPVVFQDERGVRILELQGKRCYGIALDIGTTNLVASLYDLVAERRLSTASLENPQVAFSEDILGRIHYAMLHGLDELHEALVDGVNRLVERLCDHSGIDPDGIYCATLSANTVMTHFLLGLEVRYIPVEPYIPVIHSPWLINASECGIRINKKGLLYTFPNAGSYVGGDIVAGILATGLHKRQRPSILIDVGTNAEVVIGNRDRILVSAGAAGPALEGGILRSGMRAEGGAIYRIEINDHDRTIKYRTIKDEPPRGICGSGVIDLVAELYRTGIIDSRGRIRTKTSYIRQRDGESFIEITESVAISEREIENFLRSKAAMFTSIYVLVKSLGLEFSDIENIYIAGALGSGVRVENAQLLGMLPRIDKERYIAAGNTALKGSELVLANSDMLKEVRDIHGRITYHEMNTDGEFMRLFPSALFIPHAEPAILG